MFVRLIAAGQGLLLSMLLGVWRAVAGPGPPYSAALTGWSSAPFALPHPAVPPAETGGCPGYAGRSVGAELLGSLAAAQAESEKY